MGMDDQTRSVVVGDDPTKHWGTERQKDHVAVVVCLLFFAAILYVVADLIWFR